MSVNTNHIATGVELARILRVTPETIREWRKAKRIPAIIINATTIRYDVDEVIEKLRSGMPGSEADA